MHQIWADKYTQETVIKKDHSLPFDYANLFWFRANILELGQWYCILLMQLCRKFDLLNLLCGVDPHFWLFGRKYRKKIIESRYIGIFLIIGKIIDIDMKFLNLSVIWRNYRQNYRYRNWLEIYRKVIDIEKNDLSPTPTGECKSNPSHWQIKS